MSRYDNIRKRRQKIKELLKSHNALSTEMIKELLTKEGFRVNLRTIQRDIDELQTLNEVVANPPVGREQTYSLAKTEKQEKPVVTPHLINSLWKEMRRISHIAIHGKEDITPQPQEALQEMLFLIARLPKPLKQKILPLEKQVTKRINETYMKRKEALRQNQHQEAARLYDELLSECQLGVMRLIDELSNLLYDLQT